MKLDVKRAMLLKKNTTNSKYFQLIIFTDTVTIIALCVKNESQSEILLKLKIITRNDTESHVLYRFHLSGSGFVVWWFQNVPTEKCT